MRRGSQTSSQDPWTIGIIVWPPLLLWAGRDDFAQPVEQDLSPNALDKIARASTSQRLQKVCGARKTER